MKKLFALLVCLFACSPLFAQNISLDIKDAPVRTTLEMIFKQAGIKSYVIDNSVRGFLTMTLTDQPFENTLKLVMRANTVPLSYTKENDVYIVKERVSTPTPQETPVLSLSNPVSNSSWERISLTYIDPFDLQSVLGNILFITQFSRYTGGNNGSGMGSFGNSFGNSSFGGIGSFGGQAGNGMGGGAMGGFGGMMNGQGGMMGNGGFGGGRNF